MNHGLSMLCSSLSCDLENSERKFSYCYEMVGLRRAPKIVLECVVDRNEQTNARFKQLLRYNCGFKQVYRQRCKQEILVRCSKCWYRLSYREGCISVKVTNISFPMEVPDAKFFLYEKVLKCGHRVSKTITMTMTGQYNTTIDLQKLARFMRLKGKRAFFVNERLVYFVSSGGAFLVKSCGEFRTRGINHFSVLQNEMGAVPAYLQWSRG